MNSNNKFLMQEVVKASNLEKNYVSKKQSVNAVKNVSFSIAEGELFGIIGPDGAGKTSLFRMLTTLLLPDAGVASVAGFDIVKDYKEIRKIVGYMPGRFSLYQDLTVKENLEFFATIFNTTVEANYELIKNIYQQIEPFADRKAGKLSGGMKQKLALSCALIHRPTVLFLDEPTTGVDAVSRKEFWEILKHLKSEGITILVSTPYMDEAGLCDRVALMHHGSLLKTDTPANIISQFNLPLLAAKSSNMFALLNTLRSSSMVKDVYPFGEYHHVILHDEKQRKTFSDQLTASMDDLEISFPQPNIEDCFINMIAH